MRRSRALALILGLVMASCGGDDGETAAPSTTSPAASTTVPSSSSPSSSSASSASSSSSTATSTSAAPPSTAAPTTAPATPGGAAMARFESAGARFEVTEVARNLDTVWSLAWDPSGALWYTERSGRLTRLGERPQGISGVEESGEAGLMGLEIDGRGRRFVMYTGREDNRIVRLEADGSQRVLVAGIAKAAIHDGGRLRFGADGMLYASTGDAGRPPLAQDRASLNGKVLRIDPESGDASVFSLGHRNIQGLCLTSDGRLLATEHGPDRGDEVNVISQGFNGGWPDTVGNGIKNYTPTIALAGCEVYSADLVPAWRGSMLFVTLKGRNLHRLSFRPDGSVASDEVLLDGVFGRLRDVRTGPDGAVYLATSNRDGRGSPTGTDDRILRIAPVR